MTLRRVRVRPRPDWEETATRIGYDYARNVDGSHAWREDVCYVFARSDIARLRRAAEALHTMCLALVEDAVNTPGGLDAFHIPAAMQPVVRNS